MCTFEGDIPDLIPVCKSLTPCDPNPCSGDTPTCCGSFLSGGDYECCSNDQVCDEYDGYVCKDRCGGIICQEDESCCKETCIGDGDSCCDDETGYYCEEGECCGTANCMDYDAECCDTETGEYCGYGYYCVDGPAQCCGDLTIECGDDCCVIGDELCVDDECVEIGIA